MKYAIVYGFALLLVIVIDAMWIGIVAREFYSSRIGAMMLDKPRIAPAVAFYLLWTAGLVWFAILPALGAAGLSGAAVNGALFGLFTYMTYSATNYAVMRGFDGTVAAVDAAWGTSLGALVAFSTVAVLNGRLS